MKVEITDDIKDAYMKALIANDYNDDDALEAVAPLIADMALERAAAHFDGHRLPWHESASTAIRALKEPTP